MDETLPAFIRRFTTSIQTNRILDYGWEEIVSDFPADRLREMARHLPAAADALLIVAEMKETDNHGAP